MTESQVHTAICKYLQTQYPKVLFTSEQSGLKVTKNQAVQLKKTRSCSGLPDIMIFEPRHNYHGLFLEVKKEGTIIYRKDGDLTANSHIRKQEEILHQLNSKGYMAEFVVGFDEAKVLIDYYLG
jgi:hypothetical protein